MWSTYTRFSESLLVDCSHKTNRYHYQLLTFMAMNEFGEGAVVQQSLIEANGDWHMERAIAHFKKLHPTRIDMLRVIVVDKDLNEIRVLESNFPEARILICHFHVIKYLKEMRAKPEFGKMSSDDASQVDAAIHRMVYASSEDDYKDSHESLEGLFTRIGIQEFFCLFRKELEYLPRSMGDGAVDSSKSMAERIKALIASDRRVPNECQYRLSRIGQFVNSNYDEEMATILRFTTHFEASWRHNTLELWKSVIRIASPRIQMAMAWRLLVFSKHRLRLDNWQCYCEFAMSMKLPCRHATAYRKKKQVGSTLIPWNCIDERWTSCSRDLKKVKQFSYERFEASTMGT
ncbi:LOW QUALITY PROTEIN: hypothetical protein PHMEG_00020476 [Phytophthora megakarya]|uniref:ZSWIM1/3 RNaseH-like domain-containing protein n=1 Tax=Phytophthora megakarya TaxID=4795 RepID=A0A225VQJ2_9STRA|nr:LOW QUALITY PROTEIN: hypothetical protein PHMEG_00020476 [Phytophthora megakarya]